jgi:hypothetical protein
LKFPIQKGGKLFSEKTEKIWRKRYRKGSATFLLHLEAIAEVLKRGFESGLVAAANNFCYVSLDYLHARASGCSSFGRPSVTQLQGRFS